MTWRVDDGDCLEVMARMEIHGGPDDKGRYHYTGYHWDDCPIHCLKTGRAWGDGETPVPGWRGQVFFAQLPTPPDQPKRNPAEMPGTPLFGDL
jgi:hypothetical protein